MRETVRVDRSGAVEIAKAAMEFDWTWTRSDLADFIVRVGWSDPLPSNSTASAFESWTGLDVESPLARFSGDDQRIDHIVVTVADTGEGDGRDVGPDLAVALQQVSTGLWSLWGEPTGVRVSDESGFSWTFPNLVVGLTLGARSVDLWLICPAAQERIIEYERHAVTTFAASTSWQTCAAAIAVLAQADPGTWSADDVDDVFTELGWTGTRADEFGVRTAESGAISVDATPSTPYQRRFGFGDFRNLRLRNRLPQKMIDIAYTAALEICIRLLGTPSLVGGPDAFTTWRRTANTLTLSRSQAWVMFEVRPTEATENEDASDCEWDDGWEPAQYWSVRPDVTIGRDDIDGMWHAPTPTVTEWDSFDSNLSRLFASIGADLPLLSRFTNTIVWVIMAEGITGFVAQGWFSARRNRVEVIEHGDIVFRDYPPGRAGTEQIAEITMAAVRTAADSPRQLRYYAFATKNPQHLWTFRLGITESPDEQ
ncbi:MULTISPECIES: DUF6301 family protein [unclassified Nocardia]|uniref:DUF6301 family protein n=1 Tax=unclassified Nocardia TaxID=2637762 RepID=UPI001CE43943|nr:MULTISPECIES: DUF6301 family protein [unclassified Nocardia]